MAEYVEREAVANALVEKWQKSTRYKIGDFWELNWNEIKEVLDSIPSADVQPVVRCKDCKHFHLNYFGEVNGVNIIVAHEICDLWADGCRTMQNAFCSNGVRKDGET